MRYELVVIGGGPSGAMASNTAAKNGLKVLLIEKRSEVGQPVRCGEGLPNSVCKKFKIKPRSYFNKVDHFDFISPELKVIRFKSKNYVVDRRFFDKELVDRAKDAGAEVWTESRCTGLVSKNGDFKKVEIKRENETIEIEAEVFIAADGVESEVGRMAGIDTTLKLSEIGRAAAAVMRNVNVEKNIMQEYFLKEAMGYLWIFPKSESVANVGVGIINSAKNIRPIKLLGDYVDKTAELRGGKIDYYTSGGVPMTLMLEKLQHKNLLFAGDAARLSNPIGGDGIFQAMVSGELAALTATEFIEKTDSKILMDYDNRLKNTELDNRNFIDIQYEFYTVQKMLLSIPEAKRAVLIESLWESALIKNSYPFSFSNVSEKWKTRLELYKIIMHNGRLKNWAFKRLFSLGK